MSESGRLAIEARGDCEVVVERDLDAPRGLVVEAFTRPILAKRWLGRGSGLTLVVCEDDLRVGGAWRYVWYGAGSDKAGLRGVHREVAVPERIVTTAFPDPPALPAAALVTVTFEEREAGTRLGVALLFDSRPARDLALDALRALAPGSLDALEELLAPAAERSLEADEG